MRIWLNNWVKSFRSIDLPLVKIETSNFDVPHVVRELLSCLPFSRLFYYWKKLFVLYFELCSMLNSLIVVSIIKYIAFNIKRRFIMRTETFHSIFFFCFYCDEYCCEYFINKIICVLHAYTTHNTTIINVWHNHMNMNSIMYVILFILLLELLVSRYDAVHRC